MKDDLKLLLFGALNSAVHVLDSLKRLEAVTDAERRLVPPERSDKEPDAAESLAEDSAVPPVEAQAELALVIGEIVDLAAGLESQSIRSSEFSMPLAARQQREQAAKLRKRADLLSILLPKPESDAPKHQPAHPDE